MLAQVTISNKTYELKDSFLPPASLRDGYAEKIAVFATATNVEVLSAYAGISSQGKKNIYKFSNGQRSVSINESFIG